VITCILLTILVLMQRPRSEGLGAAFGAGVTENVFGADTTNVLVKGTVYLGAIFFGATLLLTILTAHQNSAQQKGVLGGDLKKAASTQKATAAPTVSPAKTATTPAAAPATTPKTPAANIPSSTPTANSTPATSVSPTLSTTPATSPAQH
jgi:preprotein translocase subunit SecG